MSDLKDYHTNADSFSGSNSFSPLDSQLLPAPSLSYSEAIDLWSHATLLFHNLEWEQAFSTHRRILRQCGTDVRKGFLWFNIGAIRALLGEYYIAAEAYAKAVKYEPDFAVGWYCLGISLFELNGFRSAKKAFEKCLRSFAVEESIDYHEQGLKFVLEKTRVEWNCRQALFEKNYNKAGAPLPLDRHLGINSMPAGTLFEPPSFGENEQVDGDVINTTSLETSVGARPTPSSSVQFRQGLQTLLGNKPKQSAKFEHSNPRLQALEDEASTHLEPRKETLLSILAPSAAHRSQSVQLQPQELSPKLASESGDNMVKFSNSSTWPKSSKPPPPLPFVTTRDLSTANKAPDLPPKSTARIRARTVPQSSITSREQPVTGVIYREGSMITIEYIPTTTNFDTSLNIAPKALVRDSPSRLIHPSDTPAPLSIRFRPQGPPIRSTAPSPTSIYSRPFHSPPEPDRGPLPAPKISPKPKPTSAATQTWLDETFPPPRWDSLPAHLRPSRRPSRHQHRTREHRQHPSLSVNTSGSARLADDRHIKPPTPFAPSFPHDGPNLDVGPLRPPDRHRDSMASNDSFAIIGMGRQAARWDEGVGWVNGVGTGTGGDEASPQDGNREQRGGKGKERGKSRWPSLGSRKDR